MTAPFEKWYEIFAKPANIAKDAARKLYEGLHPGIAAARGPMVTIKASGYAEIAWRDENYYPDKNGNFTIPVACLEWLESVAYPPNRRGGVSTKHPFERIPEEAAA